MPNSNAKRLLNVLVACITAWGILFLLVGLPIFHLGFGVPIAKIASYLAICFAIQLAIIPWLYYTRKTPDRPEGRLTHRIIASTAFVTSVSMLFLYYLRRGRPDPATREFTSIGMGVTLLLAILTSIISLVSQRKGSGLDAIPRTQTEIKLAYCGFILAWFCFLFMVHEMNLPLRDVSAWVFVALCILAASAIVVGFVMRSRFFKLTTEALPHDPRKASQFWRSANFISFCCALSPTIYGVVLKILGSGWLVPGILFGLGLSFLLLWRPRQLAVSDVQPA